MAEKRASDTSDDPEFNDYRRQLALIDQVIGLQAALAEESARNSPSRARVEALETENRAMRSSATWRIGRAILLPVRLVKRILPTSDEW